MYLTSEGQEKGEKWARKAIWGNVPSDLKNKIKGGLETLTSGQFIALWTERVNRFMAGKVEPPTHYVQHATKTKKLTKVALTAKRKTKVAAIAKSKTNLAVTIVTCGVILRQATDAGFRLSKSHALMKCAFL